MQLNFLTANRNSSLFVTESIVHSECLVESRGLTTLFTNILAAMFSPL